MLGNPKYNYGDEVTFPYADNNGKVHFVKGTIEIIDRFGTFGQNDEVSYDIMVDDWFGRGTPMFVKHIKESTLIDMGEENV